jgi:hypothetical protein
MAKAILTPVKLFNAALDDAEDSPAGVVLRGALDLGSLKHLLKDDYQREAQPLSSQSRILDALTNGSRLPDVDLGMRGDDFTHREGAFYLKDPVYIVDGLQRISTIIHFVNTNPGKLVRIGGTVHLNTTKEWERERFHKLNNWRNKLSPNILLRNMRESNPGILMLYGISMNDKAFPLQGRVSWSQRMTKGELITARTFAKTVAYLHDHKVSAHRNNVEQIGEGLKKLVEVVGIQAMRENIRTFFELIDTCWGIKSVQYKEGAIYMRGQFLYVLARVLSNHYDFWQDDAEKRLFINADLRRKIAQFPINDPEVVRLAGSSGSAREILYLLLRDHINKGKTSKRLAPRNGVSAFEADDDEEEGTKVA